MRYLKRIRIDIVTALKHPVMWIVIIDCSLANLHLFFADMYSKCSLMNAEYNPLKDSNDVQYFVLDVCRFFRAMLIPIAFYFLTNLIAD